MAINFLLRIFSPPIKISKTQRTPSFRYHRRKGFYSNNLIMENNPTRQTAGNKDYIKSPPHRSWVNRGLLDRQCSWLRIFAYPNLPRLSTQWHSWICSPLQWRDRVGFTPIFPIKPLRAPVSKIYIFYCNLYHYFTEMVTF